MLIFLLAVGTALVVSFLCSIFESVLLSVGFARVEALNQDGSRAGAILTRFKREMDVPIAAILILNTAAHTIGAAVAGASYSNVFTASTLWLFSIIFTIAVLLCAQAAAAEQAGPAALDPLAMGIGLLGGLAAHQHEGGHHRQ